MIKKPLQPPTLTSVLVEIAGLPDEAFKHLKAETDGPNGFDAEKERVAILAPALETDEDTARLILTASAFFYQQVHKDNVKVEDISTIIQSLIDSVIDQDDLDESEKPGPELQDLIKLRLTQLLMKRENIERYNKHERLRWGFLPAATGFATFVDLRPNLSDDMVQIEELIPVIQFQVRTDSSAPMLKNFTFQLDPRSLKRLRDEVEKAERKLASIQNNPSIKSLMTKRLP